jgi:hypothetical protein
VDTNRLQPPCCAGRNGGKMAAGRPSGLSRLGGGRTGRIGGCDRRLVPNLQSE